MAAADPYYRMHIFCCTNVRDGKRPPRLLRRARRNDIAQLYEGEGEEDGDFGASA